MIKQIILLAVYVFAAFTAQKSSLAQSPFSETSRRVLLLKDDQVLHGEILSNGETIQILSEFGIISIPCSDIAYTGATLHDVYKFKTTYVQRSSDVLVNLADWCVANKLPIEATKEFDRAILWATDRRTADAIRERKTAALAMLEGSYIQAEMADQENDKLRQWKTQIPPATFATFKREILPILLRNCSGIACHSSNSINEFRFIANPSNSDLDVAKNLRIVLGYVSPDYPADSPLISIPITPHGRTKQIFTRDNNFTQFERLYFWTELVAREMDAYYPIDPQDRQAKLPQSMPKSTDVESNAPVPNQPLQNQTSSLAQGQIPKTNASGYTPSQRAPFDFFQQSSLVVPGTIPGGFASPAQEIRPQDTVIMTHSSTDAFEQNNVLQQLQRDPVDPFDPVLFNRQFHLQRIQNETGGKPLRQQP